MLLVIRSLRRLDCSNTFFLVEVFQQDTSKQRHEALRSRSARVRPVVLQLIPDHPHVASMITSRIMPMPPSLVDHHRARDVLTLDGTISSASRRSGKHLHPPPLLRQPAPYMMMRTIPAASIRRSLGVRLLCRCPVCGKLGDEEAMVKVGPMKTPAHDRCAFEQLGEGIVNLPTEERVKFTLAVVGPAVMRRLNDAS